MKEDFTVLLTLAINRRVTNIYSTMLEELLLSPFNVHSIWKTYRNHLWITQKEIKHVSKYFDHIERNWPKLD